jgi:hypothetical protein
LIAVSVQSDATTPTFGQHQRLFDDVGAQPSPNRHYDVAPDGARFVTIRDPPSLRAAALVVVEHWLDELKARLPIGD